MSINEKFTIKTNQNEEKQYFIPIETDWETYNSLVGAKSFKYGPIRFGVRDPSGILVLATKEQYQAYMRPIWAEMKREERSHRCIMSNGKGGSKTITNDILESPRVGSALKIDEIKPIYKTDPVTDKSNMVQEFPAGTQAHGFNNIVDNYAGYATKTPLSNATLYQLDGSLNGALGRFEWIIQDGSVTHRMFIQGGMMNGVPIVK